MWLHATELTSQKSKGMSAVEKVLSLHITEFCQAIPAGAGNERLRWVVGDAQQLPFADNSMDGYTIAFGLRNVTRIPQALQEAHRVSPSSNSGYYILANLYGVVLYGMICQELV